MIFATRSQKHRKNRGFAKNISIYSVFCSESVKKTRKHHLFDDF